MNKIQLIVHVIGLYIFLILFFAAIYWMAESRGEVPNPDLVDCIAFSTDTITLIGRLDDGCLYCDTAKSSRITKLCAAFESLIALGGAVVLIPLALEQMNRMEKEARITPRNKR